ncbi:MAG: hypothetical protein K0R29_185 [Pseudobdellovibrio sp.]|jgi:hypothetical protein|nr:hypothetical protein [Pseudobdellovibrio sp.]
MFRLINLFLTSFLVTFFAIGLIYSQSLVPNKRQNHHAENKKGHLAVTSSSVPVSNNKN